MVLLGPKIKWHSLSVEEITDILASDLNDGITDKEAKERQLKYGRNKLKSKKTRNFFDRLLSQIKNPLVFVLIIAGIITIILGDKIDSMVIFIAVFINILIGAGQEGRAGKAFEKLKNSQVNKAVVIRNGFKKYILSENLVRGDLVFLETGSSVPADLRIVESKNLEINESALTGEWIDVQKDIQISQSDSLATDQKGMAFMGTVVSGGTGKGLVVEIGDKTEIGKIADSLNTVEEEITPIQRNIHKIARFLSVLILIIVSIIFVLGILRGIEIGEMLLISIAVAVSVIPEGLPAAVTVVLALGMERILNKGGLVRNLLAAETLGSTTVILTDKTGTLTEAKMKVSDLYTLNSIMGLDSEKDKKTLLKYSILASDAFVEENQDKTEMVVRGKPIERAILLKGLADGLNQEELRDEGDERIDFLSFDSENRFAASLDKMGEHKKRIYFSGSPEHLLEKSSYVFKNGRAIRINRDHLSSFQKTQEMRSLDGLRFIGVAYLDTEISNFNEVEDQQIFFKHLVFVGLIAFEDPIRLDVKDSIRKAQNAGAKVIMITGDHKYTALKIAGDVGIVEGKARVLEGRDIDKMNDKDLLLALKETRVFARILPSQKLRITKILQEDGEIVAMTGDGINDAPALRSAHIGVAVGSGTEVAKEASDLILLDNNFSIIVSAIEEGRHIIDNLKKIIAFLFSTSFGEIFVIGAALVFGMPLPILTAQILWINLVEGGALNFAFAFEPTEKDVMKRSPTDIKREGILTPYLKKLILSVGVITGLLSAVVYFVLMSLDLPIEEVRTMMFVVLTLDAIFFSFSFKGLHDPVWRTNIFSNKYLIGAVLVSLVLLSGAFAIGPLKSILALVTLSSAEIFVLGCLGLLNLAIIELSKYFIFRRVRSV